MITIKAKAYTSGMITLTMIGPDGKERVYFIREGEEATYHDESTKEPLVKVINER